MCRLISLSPLVPKMALAREVRGLSSPHHIPRAVYHSWPSRHLGGLLDHRKGGGGHWNRRGHLRHRIEFIHVHVYDLDRPDL